MTYHFYTFKPSAWTEEQDDLLRKLWLEKPASHIAARIGSRTRNAVIGRAHRLGLGGKVRIKRNGYLQAKAQAGAASSRRTGTHSNKASPASCGGFDGKPSTPRGPALVAQKCGGTFPIAGEVSKGMNTKGPQAVTHSKAKAGAGIPTPEPIPAPAPLLLTMLDLTNSTCRFPVEGENEHTLFCGHAPKFGSRFCEFHHGVCFTKYVRPSRRRTAR